MQHEACHPTGIPNRVFDGDGAALGDTKKRKFFDTCSVDYGFQVANKCLEGDLLNVPIREAVATFVIADKAVIFGQSSEDVTPSRTLPVVFEMVEPVRCFDQRRSPTHCCICDAYAIARRAESYLLLDPVNGLPVSNHCLGGASG